MPGPDGRFLATVAAPEETCAFIDPHHGLELGRLPPARLPIAFISSGELLTHGTNGLECWPMHWEAANSLCRIGPPRRLLKSPLHAHACSADGQVVVMANLHQGSLLWRRADPGPALVLGPQEDVRGCSVSPDGRFAATANHWNTLGIGAKVWRTDNADLVKDLPLAAAAARSASARTANGC